jgi:metal-responsive CopG/Arc/MetJ family transcriptional regulator
MAVRTTLYLDEDLAGRLRRLVADRKMNRFINEALAEKLEQVEAEQLEAEMRAGYVAVAEERRELAADWATVDVEDWPS